MSVNPNMSTMTKSLNKISGIQINLLESRIQMTVSFIMEMHQEQQYGKEPFYMHPLRVFYRMKDVPGITEADMHAALLHDVVEDTEITLEDLWSMKYPWRTLQAVDQLSFFDNNGRGHNYKSWIIWLAKYGTWSARIIKYCDAMDNYLACDGVKSMRTRYKFVLDTIGKTLSDEEKSAVYVGKFTNLGAKVDD